MSNLPYILGIDEAGRGPLAGPVYVGFVLIPASYDVAQLPCVRDSKTMTELQRQRTFQAITEGKTDNEISFTVAFTKAATIDRIGIEKSIQRAINRGLKRLNPNPQQTKVYLDGGLEAPKQFIHQETIIGGDNSVSAISLASVIAKVSRDQQMVKASQKYPDFNFAQHKGYGTAMHRKMIKKCGPSNIHRRTFLTNIT